MSVVDSPRSSSASRRIVHEAEGDHSYLDPCDPVLDPGRNRHASPRRRQTSLPSRHNTGSPSRSGMAARAARGARARLRSPTNRVHPDTLDSERLYFWGGGGYCYSTDLSGSTCPPGHRASQSDAASSGFHTTGPLYNRSRHDLTVTLDRITNLRDEGWYSAISTPYSDHPPIDYQITLPRARMTRTGRGPAVLHLLDQTTILQTGAREPRLRFCDGRYYSYEYQEPGYGPFHIRTAQQAVADVVASIPFHPPGKILQFLGHSGFIECSFALSE